jgi:hypothetical protein
MTTSQSPLAPLISRSGLLCTIMRAYLSRHGPPD